MEVSEALSVFYRTIEVPKWMPPQLIETSIHNRLESLLGIRLILRFGSLDDLLESNIEELRQQIIAPNQQQEKLPTESLDMQVVLTAR